MNNVNINVGYFLRINYGDQNSVETSRAFKSQKCRNIPLRNSFVKSFDENKVQ